MNTTNISFAGIGAVLLLAATVLAQPAPDKKVPESAKSAGNLRAERDTNAPGPANAGIETVKPIIQATDEEWNVIGPKLQAVVAARQVAQTYTAGFAGAGGGGFPNFGSADSLSGPVGDSMDSRRSRARGGFGGRGGSVNPGGGGEPLIGAAAPADAVAPGSTPSAGASLENDTGRGGFDPADFPAGPPGFAPTDFPGAPGRGGRGGPGGRFPGNFGGMANPVQSAITELKTALADTSIPPEQIKAKVAAVREARNRATTDLAAAQRSLLLMLTPDQEALLLSLGYID